MLATNQPSTSRKITPNILPCSIKHDGPVNAKPRYWTPVKEEDGSSTAYFRGRKLRGRKITVPEGYQGVVLKKTDKALPQNGAAVADRLRRMEEEDDDDEEMEMEQPIDVKMMDQKAKFEEIVVWGHEMVPQDDDVYVKGVEEWISFAEAVSAVQSSYPPPSKLTGGCRCTHTTSLRSSRSSYMQPRAHDRLRHSGIAKLRYETRDFYKRLMVTIIRPKVSRRTYRGSYNGATANIYTEKTLVSGSME